MVQVVVGHRRQPPKKRSAILAGREDLIAKVGDDISHDLMDDKEHDRASWRRHRQHPNGDKEPIHDRLWDVKAICREG
jgi:hypothetical protein